MTLIHLVLAWSVLWTQWLGETERIEGRVFWQMRSTADAAPTAPDKRVIRYRILVEAGLEDEAAEFSRTVARVLADPRSWRAAGYEFVADPEGARFDIVLATPRTTDLLCLPLRTAGRYSCGVHGRAVMNAKRWRGGAASWGDEIEGYREYMVNHEVGHLIGMPHRRCPGPGEPAPVMAQQTITVDACVPAGFPAEDELARLRTKLRAKTSRR